MFGAVTAARTIVIAVMVMVMVMVATPGAIVAAMLLMARTLVARMAAHVALSRGAVGRPRAVPRATVAAARAQAHPCSSAALRPRTA